MPNTTHLVCSANRLEENTKWSIKWPVIRTEKYRVGNWIVIEKLDQNMSYITQLDAHVVMYIGDTAHYQEGDYIARWHV